jgi:phosphoenolpyruvate carboxylase
MYRGWPFFRTLVDFMQMNLAKSDMRISETYTDPLPETVNHDRLRRRISEEHDSCVEAVLHVTGHENLMDNGHVLQRPMRLRNPYVDPLSYVQVSLLRRLRAVPEDPPSETACSSPSPAPPPGC